MKKIIGDVELNEFHLREIPSEFNDVIIDGDFDISDNSITTLNNFPIHCYRAHLSRNPLKSLVGIKQKVISFIEVNGTRLTNLEGCPETVGILVIKNTPSFNSLSGTLKNINNRGTLKIASTSLQTMKDCPDGRNISFVLFENKLTSLIGMPKVCHDLNIGYNKLTNLIGCPEHITGHFRCENNNLQNFDGFPKVIEGNCTLTVSPMFNNQLMNVKSYFLTELRKRCKIYGQVELKDPPSGGLI